MQTRQIPKTEWPSFLENFSRRHEGWLVTLEILNPEISAQVEATGLVLEGLTGERDEARGDTITIMAGNTPDDHLTHSIIHPTEVSLERTDGGADAALLIKSVDGTTSLLSFRSGVLPELIDGL